MSKIKIGINGFGRIGRMVMRASLQRDDIEVVAVNDLLDIDHLAYLLNYDSVHGKCNADISVKNNNLVIDGKEIIISAERDPKNINWESKGVDIVAECTGIFTTLETAQYHIDGGAPKVVISAPSKDAPMYVMGVNHGDVDKNDLIISNASCTTNCLAPLTKVLNDSFVVEEALMTTVHAVTATQFTVDGPSKKDYRGGRSSLLNIIPASTGAAKAVTKVIPSSNVVIHTSTFKAGFQESSITLILQLSPRSLISMSYPNISKCSFIVRANFFISFIIISFV